MIITVFILYFISNLVVNLYPVLDNGIVTIFFLITHQFLLVLFWIIKGRHLKFSKLAIPLLVLIVYTLLLHKHVSLWLVIAMLNMALWGVISLNRELLRSLHRITLYLILLCSTVVVVLCLVGGNLHVLRLNDYPEVFSYTIFGNPNLYSRYLIVSFFVFLATAQNNNNKKLEYFIAAVVVVNIAIFAISRANMVAVVVGYAVFLILAQKKKRIQLNALYCLKITLVTILVIISAHLLLTKADMFLSSSSPIFHHLDRIKGIESEIISNLSTGGIFLEQLQESRAKMFLGSWYAFLESPLIGLGKEAKFYVADIANTLTVENVAKPIHGGILSIALMYGIIGVLLFTIFYVRALMYALKRGQNKQIVAAIVGLLVSAFISQLGANIYNMPLFWLALSLLYAIQKYDADSKMHPTMEPI